MHYQHLPDWSKLSELVNVLDLKNPPKELYFRGKWKPGLFSTCVAIVGSRRMTEYGRQVIEKIVPRLVFEKKTIVSGFMYGVDQYAHQVCLENGGKTIAILGWGIKQTLEGTDKKLAERIIASGGLMLSEWEDQKPTLWTFPVRNRIVAALCDDVIVVEAAVKSGSLITARLALELKRTLWAVPGPITSRTSEGTNMLIAKGHARMWTEENKNVEKSGNPLVDLLSDEALSADDIARKLNKSVADVGAQLSMLTITGDLVERGGKFYAGKN